MKKFFGFLVMLMLCVCNVNGQNIYTNFNVGLDFNTNTNLVNTSLNLQIGYICDEYQSIELDYTHGLKKDLLYYNRIGANYMFNFTNKENKLVPYLKLGCAYKSIGVDKTKFNIELCDIKIGIGFNYWVNNNTSIKIGIDLTNGFNDNINFDWDNKLFAPNIGFTFIL